MNYDLPYNLQNFVNLPIWEGEWGNRRRRNLEELQSQDNGKNTWWHIAAKYNELNDTQPKNHPSDFTAGELYHDLENLLTSYGFHDTCLLRSVCELARHPFDDAQQNLITEILTFLLTPSLHEAFSDSETMYREVYETAERRGFLHHNCADLYSECQEDLLTALTNVDMANNVNA
uniref:Uncharacterized protein n=1 Tax=Stomoxys calcitrans TaxID=35570 RepID=A0A1I8NPC1_STOCA